MNRYLTPTLVFFGMLCPLLLLFGWEIALLHLAIGLTAVGWMRRPRTVLLALPVEDGGEPVVLGQRGPLSRAQQLRAVERGGMRAAAGVALEMQRGVPALAAIAGSACFFGVFGTVLGIIGSFHAVCGEKTAIMAALASELGDSLVPIVLSLAVAVPAWMAHQYFERRGQELRVEMRNGVLELMDAVARWK